MILMIARYLVSIALISSAMSFGQESAAIDDGPYLFHQKDGSVVARWVKAGQVHTATFAKGAPVVLPQFSFLLGKSFAIEKHAAPPAIYDMPARLLAISDVEGQYDRLLRFLKINKVINKDGHWIWGKGHLVCVGDFVDRGEKVTETLWLMLRLEREAAAAGGQVHFLIGNHEAMVLAGDLRYTAPKYKHAAKALGLEAKALMGANTELGRWLRSRNSLIRIGEYVFVHAGISSELVTPKVDYSAINKSIRSVLGVAPREIKDKRAQWLAWGRKGVLWYRGYFKKHAKKYGPRPSNKALAHILLALDCKSIVIGHTKVKKVEAIYSGRQVINIDTTWTSDDKVRGILATKKKLDVLDIRGKRTRFKTP